MESKTLLNDIIRCLIAEYGIEAVRQAANMSDLVRRVESRVGRKTKEDPPKPSLAVARVRAIKGLTGCSLKEALTLLKDLYHDGGKGDPK